MHEKAWKSRQQIQPHKSQNWTNPDTGMDKNIISRIPIDYMSEKIELQVAILNFSYFNISCMNP